MRLRILGKTSDDKGAQLEQLTKRLLEGLGYRQVALNVVGSGGNEVDIRAEYPVPGLQEVEAIRLIGECKAYESPINLPDWLKFLGKIYTEELRRPNQVHGLLVCLSGANGNVLGAADELRKLRSNVSILTGERLAERAIQEFNLMNATQVTREIQKLTSTPITELSLAYYGGEAYWVAAFSDSSFTIIANRNTKTRSSPELASLISAQLPATYRDLLEDEEARRALVKARKHVLAHLLLSPKNAATIPDLIDAAARTEAGFSDHVMRRAIESLHADTLLSIAGDDAALVDVVSDVDSRVRILHELTDEFILTSAVCTPAWIGLIDDGLMDKILAIQGSLAAPLEVRQECMRLFQWSPSALSWALRPDPMLVVHRSDKSPVTAAIDENDVRYFRIQALVRAVSDFNNGSLARIYLERIGLRELAFVRRAEFKSTQKVELALDVAERLGIARAAPELGGGVVRVWMHAGAPEPWDWPGQKDADVP